MYYRSASQTGTLDGGWNTNWTELVDCISEQTITGSKKFTKNIEIEAPNRDSNPRYVIVRVPDAKCQSYHGAGEIFLDKQAGKIALHFRDYDSKKELGMIYYDVASASIYFSVFGADGKAVPNRVCLNVVPNDDTSKNSLVVPTLGLLNNVFSRVSHTHGTISSEGAVTMNDSPADTDPASVGYIRGFSKEGNIHIILSPDGDDGNINLQAEEIRRGVGDNNRQYPLFTINAAIKLASRFNTASNSIYILLKDGSYSYGSMTHIFGRGNNVFVQPLNMPTSKPSSDTERSVSIILTGDIEIQIKLCHAIFKCIKFINQGSSTTLIPLSARLEVLGCCFDGGKNAIDGEMSRYILRDYCIDGSAYNEKIVSGKLEVDTSISIPTVMINQSENPLECDIHSFCTLVGHLKITNDGGYNKLITVGASLLGNDSMHPTLLECRFTDISSVKDPGLISLNRASFLMISDYKGNNPNVTDKRLLTIKTNIPQNSVFYPQPGVTAYPFSGLTQVDGSGYIYSDLL